MTHHQPNSSSSTTVIGSQFTAPYEFYLVVTRSDEELSISDINNKNMLTVINCDTKLHKERLVLDEFERPIATLREKNITAHARWNVFRGQSKEPSDMIFSTKKNHMIQFKTHMNVTMARNMSHGDECDFKIKGDWTKGICKIYKKDSSKTIAQTNPGKLGEKLIVKIDPNVDYAFVVALIAIVHAIESPRETKDDEERKDDDEPKDDAEPEDDDEAEDDDEGKSVFDFTFDFNFNDNSE